MGYRVAVVGATGAVGREMLKTLAERRFPVDEVAAVASGRSTGQEVSFGEKQVLRVQSLESFDFRGWDIGLFSPGASVSAVHAPRAAAAGVRGRPGIVMISPHTATTKPAPADSRTSRTGRVKPVGAPITVGSAVKLNWVLAMHTGT